METEIIIYGMLYACPALHRKQGCPFKQIESLPFREKVILLKELSPEEKEKVVEYHRFCSTTQQ